MAFRMMQGILFATKFRKNSNDDGGSFNMGIDWGHQSPRTSSDRIANASADASIYRQLTTAAAAASQTLLFPTTRYPFWLHNTTTDTNLFDSSS
mmetsp:Transcript_12156/g.22070  ORF Transcript_12156/g.22070 Transcript_12156/m.22070 type:complete len:94 (+) Transcript_12156:847-1128(+)